MKRLISLLAAAALLAAFATNASAATSGPFTIITPIPYTLTDWSGSLLFPQFNPNLGVLNSVELDFTSSMRTTLTVQNAAASSSSGTAWTEMQVSIQDTGHNLSAPAIDSLSPSFHYNLDSGQNVTSPLLTMADSSSDVYTLAAVLAEFTGFGNVSLNGSTFTVTVLSTTGLNTSASQTGDASLTGSVIYNYTPVPEPSVFALLGLGLVVLPILRRKRS